MVILSLILFKGMNWKENENNFCFIAKLQLSYAEVLLQMNQSNRRKKMGGGTFMLSNCGLSKAKGKVTLRESFNLLFVKQLKEELCDFNN